MAGEIDLSQFHEVFFEESFEGLGVMEAGLLALDASAPNTETINNVFRAAHSIKGGAATFGFEEVSGFTHVMESLLDEVRGGNVPVGDALVQVLLESVDFLRFLLQSSQAGRELPESQVLGFIERLSAFETGEPAPASVTSAAEPAPAGKWQIRLQPSSGLFATGNDPARLIRDLEELGEVETRLDAASLPELDQIEPGDCYLAFDIMLSAEGISEAEIREVFDWVADDVLLTITAPAGPEAVADPSPQQPVPEDPVDAPLGNAALPPSVQEVTSIRVNIDRVDLLVNLVGELVITQSMISRFKSGEADVDELIRGIEQLEENTRELQEQTMRMRMLPIDTVFQRLPRLVRDLSRSLDKEVALHISGEGTEVDKTVLEKISDPLTHLVRNCLDHGIESPAERKRVGKSASGSVHISAFHEGGSIVVRVEDDGRGLDRGAIQAKAVQQGIVDASSDLTDNQVDQLIFSPGFSTVATVSDVSGRGVGMDVVKSNIEQLNGHIDVTSEAGAGCIFTIRLPLTLAIIEGQLVRVGSDVFVVPLLSIVKSTRITAGDYNIVAGDAGMFHLDDDYIPVVPLRDVYRIGSDYDEIEDAILVIVDAVERYGILVDEVLGQQQVVVKSLEANFREVPTLSGATILGDGTVAMILDMPGLLRESRTRKELLEVTHEH